MLIVNRYGLYALKLDDIYFMNRVIRYALLAMQKGHSPLLDTETAVTLKKVASEIEVAPTQEVKYLSLPFVTNEGEALIAALEAALDLQLIFDEDLYKSDSNHIRTLLPKLSQAVQRFNEDCCIPVDVVEQPAQLQLLR